MGLLESAKQRPVNKWLYCQFDSPPDLFDLAAAYAFGIVSNHAFHDGNKRTGAAVSILFLRLNGVELSVIHGDLVNVFVALAVGAVSESGLADWFRSRATK